MGSTVAFMATQRKMKVAHIIKALGRPNDSFLYRMVTNASVDNVVRCEKREDPGGFPHARVSCTASLSKTVGYLRRFGGNRIAEKVRRLLFQRSWNQFIAKERPDVIHVQQGDLAVRLIEELEETRVPTVVTFHGSDINCATYKNGFLARLRRVFRRAERCHFVSNALRLEGRALGCDDAKSIVEYLGTPIPSEPVRYSSRTDDFRVAIAANLVPCKGHETLLDAIHRVVDRLAGATLHIYGDGPLRDRLHWLIDQRSLCSNVMMHGNIPYSELQRILQWETDVLALCSQRDDLGAREGLPMCLVEAAAIGMPLVGSRCGGIPEIVRDGETGLLVDQRDANGLARALLQLGRDPDLRQRLGTNARSLAIRFFNVEQQLLRLAGVYEEMAEESKRQELSFAGAPVQETAPSSFT